MQRCRNYSRGKINLINNMNEEFLNKVIKDLFEGYGQNAEWIAEMMEENDLNYDEELASKLLEEMRKIIETKQNKELLVYKFCKF